MLELQEVGVGFEVRVCLAQGEDVGQRLVELFFGLRVLCHAFCLDGFVARSDHGVEGVLLVFGVTLDSLDQVGDEVVAFFQLHIYAAPALFHHGALADEFVV